LAAVISGKNILAFLHGHWHRRSVQEWWSIPVIAPAGFAYSRPGCPKGDPYLGVVRITESALSVYGFNWENRSFDEKPLYERKLSLKP